MLPMFSIVFTQTAFATGEPEITGGSNVSGQIDEYIPIAGLTITGDSVDPIPVRISVPSGHLSMTTTTNLTFSTSETGSNIAFQGSKVDINNALATLRYRSSNVATVELSVTLTDPGLVYFPGNGHFYEIVNESLDWIDAKNAASLRTKNGATGYLATVTTQEENDYISPRLSGDGWIGASDSDTEGASENDWQWVTGPETGTSFWSGLADGAPVDGLYSNWVDGVEPNNYADGEDCAQFYADGSGWNDLPCDGYTLSSYVVEYGTEGVLPTAPSMRTLSITTSMPTPEDITIGSCLDLINVATNPDDNRFNNLNLTSNIDCTGETIAPMFNTNDVDFGFLGFRGVFDGGGYSINNLTIEGSDNNTGLIASAYGATFRDISINGEISTSVDDFCTGGLVGRATNTAFENISVTASITGRNDTGGIVGCLYAENGNASVTDSIADAGIIDNYGYENIGGLVGVMDSSDTSNILYSGNISYGLNVPISYDVGGHIGEIDANDTSQIVISNSVTPGDVNGDDDTGGIAGNVSGNNGVTSVLMDNVSMDGDMVTSGDTGGIVGDADSMTISNTYMTGSITNDSDDTGGLFGILEDSLLNNSYATGDVVATGDAGGLVGQVDDDDTTISESFATGDVTGDDDRVGGLVGANQGGTILKSYATGDVVGYSRVGGLTGANGGTITNSYARGSTTGDNNVGGLSGRCGGEIVSSYATGLVDGATDTGGLVGYQDSCLVTDSFWDTETTGQETTEGDGTGKSSAEMKDKNTFTNIETSGLSFPWDFENTWNILATVNNGYPCLTWQDSCSPAETEDLNGDEIPDSEQPNVGGYISTLTNKIVAIDVGGSCELTTDDMTTESNLAVQDPAYEYDNGLWDFEADCGTPGYTTTIKLYYYNVDKADQILRKYNPNTKIFFNINDAAISNQTISGQNVTVVTYQVTDGGERDIDGVADGMINDPAGLARAIIGAPNTGLR